MTPLEKDIEKALGRMVRGHGGLCLKWVCPGWLGVPDRIILLPGARIVFVELKRPTGGKVAAIQKFWARKLSELGFVHLWVKNHEDVKAVERFIVDAAPVMHGRWEPELMPTGVEYSGYQEMTVQALSCSVCGKCIDVSEGYFSHCPNCGANMMDLEVPADG